jgi:hypothetical protein
MPSSYGACPHIHGKYHEYESKGGPDYGSDQTQSAGKRGRRDGHGGIAASVCSTSRARGTAERLYESHQPEMAIAIRVPWPVDLERAARLAGNGVAQIRGED